MINFLEETKKAIVASGHNTKDIVFIGSIISGQSCSWATFKEMADAEYSNDFGSVASDLKIIFSDGSWLERESELWEFKPVILEQIPKKQYPLTNIFVEATWIL